MCKFAFLFYTRLVERYLCEGRGADVRIQGDVSTKEGVNKIAEQIKEKEQVVDSLINCAGVIKPWKEPIKDHNNGMTYISTTRYQPIRIHRERLIGSRRRAQSDCCC